MGPGLPLPGYQQAGRAILAIIIVILGKSATGTFTVEPDDQCAADGQSVQFSCETTDTSSTPLYWSLVTSGSGQSQYVAGNDGAADGYNVLFDDSGSSRKSTLTVLGVTTAMSGNKYYCRVGPTRTKNASLTVTECSWCDNVRNSNSGIKQYVTVNLQYVPEPCELKAGTVNFKLDLNSSPQEFDVYVTMTLNGEEILGASKLMKYDCETNYAPLTISGITIVRGKLSVSVTINHPSLSSSKFYPLEDCSIIEPPKKTNIGLANPYIVVEGEDAVITCKASDGNPDEYQYRYRQPANNWSAWTSNNEQVYSKLQRNAVGVYWCQSKNTAGSGPEDRLNLQLHYPPEYIEVSASNSVVGDSYFIKEGEYVGLDCAAYGGNPAADSYMWTKEEGHFKIQHRAQLRINNIERNSGGKYRCLASNKLRPTNKPEQLGTVAKLVAVTVQYAPELESTVPQALKQAVAVGESLSLSVEVDANPLPVLEWRRLIGNFPASLPSSGFEVHNTDLGSKLIILEVTEEKYDNYTCIAANSVGHVDITFHVGPQERPDRPSNMKVMTTAVSIIVEWDRGWDGGLAQVFRLRYSEATKLVPDSRVHYNVKLNADDGILEFTEYTIVLSAENSEGSSSAVTFTVRTKAKPTVDTEGTVITLDKEDHRARIRWSVYHSESFDRILVTVCEINSQQCMKHNITNTHDASRIALPTGSKYLLSFFMYDAEELVSTQENAIVIGDGRSGRNYTIIVVMVVVALLLIVGCSVAIGCFIWRRSKKTGRERSEVEMSGCGNRGLPDRPRRLEMRNSSEPHFREDDGTEYEQTHPEYVNQHLQKSHYAVLKPLNNPEKQEVVYEEVRPKGCECSFDDVKQESMVYSSDLFEVYRATSKKIEGVKPGTVVLVKRTKEGTPPIVQSILLNEIKALRAVGDHPNVVSILANCTFSEPVLMVLKSEHHGRLDVYLDGPGRDIAQRVLQTMSIDVVKGMSYLADLRPDILHYCLAAKHIMVSDAVTCKVSGFGFADHVLEKEEYERVTGLEQDVRWMAPEQLRHNIHSKKSDIWAYGVLMWEIYSYGQAPYPNMPSDEVKQYVLSGSVLGRPSTLPVGMYQTMLECLRNEEQERPNFQQLLRTLEHLE